MSNILLDAGLSLLLFRNNFNKAEKKSTPSLVEEPVFKYMTDAQKRDLIEHLRQEMKEAAKGLEFERAAELRDEIGRLEAAVSGGKE